MQKQDLEILYSFVLGQMYSFIEFCKERGLSECEADRIVDERVTHWVYIKDISLPNNEEPSNE